ncbi:MAG: hypothetical protein K0Q59_4901 [Paenibacillus sp.]|jgi:hypothetical protein|nr:hypothetical protein [Paenibacillus sp.]
MMRAYYIAGTKSSPTVHFDPAENMLLMEGQSYPENAFKLFEPIFAWVDEYLQQLGDSQVVCEFRMPYMNTSSTKCIIMLLEKFDNAHANGKQIQIRWICNPENESETECAEELKEDLSLPFDIVLKEDS